MTVGSVVIGSVGSFKGGNLRTAELVVTDAPMPTASSSVYVPFVGASNDWGIMSAADVSSLFAVLVAAAVALAFALGFQGGQQ